MSLISKKFIYKLSAIAIPTLFLAISLIVAMYLQKSYHKTEKELFEKEGHFASFELAENLRRHITYRVNILEIVSKARPDIFPNNEAYFHKIIPVIIDNLPGFYAINWVDPQGIIRWVSPLKGNEAAINKPLLTRPELASYMLAARDQKTPHISHIIDLYQGFKGLVMYIPIYDKDVFKGWYNGVIDVRDSFDRFFESRNFKNIHVLLKWKGHDDYIYTYGEDRVEKKGAELRFESQVLNQTLIANVDIRRGSAMEERADRLNTVFLVIYISIGLIALFLFYLIRSQFKIINMNQALSRDKTLLNILIHDMATPLTLISENIGRLKDKLKGQNFTEVDRIAKSSDKQKDLFLKVKSFHATNMGKIKVDLVPVNAMEIINETLTLFDELRATKGITFKIEHPNEDLYCLTDRVTAINNVFSNVISNAIKFSAEECEIIIRVYRYKKCIVIETQDCGTGIPSAQLKNLFLEQEITTTKGTKGEIGTGLGMLQIKTFMELYKGFIKIHPSETGTKVQLYFRSTDI